MNTSAASLRRATELKDADPPFSAHGFAATPYSQSDENFSK